MSAEQKKTPRPPSVSKIQGLLPLEAIRWNRLSQKPLPDFASVLRVTRGGAHVLPYHLRLPKAEKLKLEVCKRALAQVDCGFNDGQNSSSVEKLSIQLYVSRLCLDFFIARPGWQL